MEKKDAHEKGRREDIEDLDKLIKQRFDYHLNKCKNIATKAENKKKSISVSKDDTSDDSEGEKVIVKPKQNKTNDKVTVKGKKKIKKIVESDNDSSDEEIVVKLKKVVKKKANNKKIDMESESDSDSETKSNHESSEDEIKPKSKKVTKKKKITKDESY